MKTVDLLIKVVCFIKEVNKFFSIKGADLNWLVVGGKLYWAFPFSKTSLVGPWCVFSRHAYSLGLSLCSQAIDHLKCCFKMASGMMSVGHMVSD